MDQPDIFLQFQVPVHSPPGCYPPSNFRVLKPPVGCIGDRQFSLCWKELGGAEIHLNIVLVMVKLPFAEVSPRCGLCARSGQLLQLLWFPKRDLVLLFRGGKELFPPPPRSISKQPNTIQEHSLRTHTQTQIIINFSI